jgi:hypothetical protein
MAAKVLDAADDEIGDGVLFGSGDSNVLRRKCRWRNILSRFLSFAMVEAYRKSRG